MIYVWVCVSVDVCVCVCVYFTQAVKKHDVCAFHKGSEEACYIYLCVCVCVCVHVHVYIHRILIPRFNQLQMAETPHTQ